MSFTFLIALFLAHGLEPPGLGQPARIGLRIATVCLGGLAVVALARWISVWAVGSLQADPLRRPVVLRRYHRMLFAHELLSIAVLGFSAYVVNWTGIVRTAWGLRNIWIVEDLLLIAPYLAAEMLAAICFYAVEEAIRQGGVELAAGARQRWSCRNYLSFQFRGRFGVLLCSTMLLSGLRDLADWSIPQWTESPALAAGLTFAMALTVLIVAPLILRVVWIAKSLPAGPLRDELEELSRRLRFRASDILVWNTGHGVSNAAIAGLVPQLRYVLLSDALLTDLSPDEVGAVFGHEVGHVRHRHLVYYFAFILVGSFATASVGQLGEAALRLQAPSWLAQWTVPVLDVAPLWALAMIPLWFFGFGQLSRRCERQADLYGARAASQTIALRPMQVSAFDAATAPYENGVLTNGHAHRNGIVPVDRHRTDSLPCPKLRKDPVVTVEGASLFIQALEKVALVNGLSRTGWNWRHGSIAQRIAFLEQVAADPSLADRYDRRLFFWTLGLGVGLLAVGGAAVALGMHYFPNHFAMT